MPYSLVARVDAEFGEFHGRIGNVMQQHDRDTKLGDLADVRGDNEEGGEDVVDEHLPPILHLWLEKDCDCGKQIISHLQGIQNHNLWPVENL